MFKSDIFEEYAQTMLEKGLVKKAAKEPKEEDKPERGLRPVNLEDLKNLYHNNPNDQDPKKNIIEIAHPDTAIAGRAYDAMNAVIENEQQRHNIMTWIALKMPTGFLTNQRYVKYKSDLMGSLVQVAFKADNENDDEIRKMADACINQLSKEAAAPLALLAVAVVPFLAYLGWNLYGGVSVQNVYANAKLLSDQLTDVSDKPYYNPLFKTCQKLIKDAADFDRIRTKSISGSLRSVEDVVKKVTDKQSLADVQRLEEIEKIWDMFLQIYPAFHNAVKASMAQGDKEEHADWWQKIKNVGESIIPGLNEEKQVLDYLEGLKDAVVEAKKQAQELKNAGAQKAEELKPQIENKIQEEEKKQSNVPNLEDLVKEFESHVPKA